MTPRQEKIEAREKRRNEIAELFLQGWTQAEIGKKLSLSQGTVSRNLGAIRKVWNAKLLGETRAARAEALKRLDRLERQAWEGWERSQLCRMSAQTTKSAKDETLRRTGTEQHGEPRYLEVIRRCVAERRYLLRLSEKEKSNPREGPDHDPQEGVERICAALSRLRERQQAHESRRNAAEAAAVESDPAVLPEGFPSAVPAQGPASIPPAEPMEPRT